MVKIEIEIPRPGQILLLVGFAASVAAAVTGVTVGDAIGGGGQRAQVIVEAESQIRDARREQEVIARREELLRYHLAVLADEYARSGYDPALGVEIARDAENLRSLLQDRFRAEEAIRQSLHDLWDVQGIARTGAQGHIAESPMLAVLPVDATLGVSAGFQDPAYEERFRITHTGTDFPVEQESSVRAADDGVVISVSDKGMGFNSLAIRHESGLVTLYGHLSAFLVAEGERVAAGQEVGLSGGRPGTPGAGLLTTGPHLHFEVYRSGEAIDPLSVLPPLP